MRLIDSEIKKAKISDGDKPFKMYDGGSLYLLVRKSGKYWRYDYRINGKRKTLALGMYPDIPLAGKQKKGIPYQKGARELLSDAKSLVNQGIDPCFLRQQEKRENLAAMAEKKKKEVLDGNTFEVVATKWFEHFKTGWADSYSCKVKGRLERYVFPVIGDMPIITLTKSQVLECIEKVVNQGMIETAKRLFQMIRSIFDYAYAHDWVSLIPMSADRKLIIPVGTSQKMPAITDKKKIGELLRATEGYGGTFVVCMALKLLPYVSLRSGEFRNSKWNDLDLDNGYWVVPAITRKLKKSQKENSENVHIVPLSHQAMGVLKKLREVTGHGDYLFPSVRGYSRPMSENTINSALHGLGYKGKMVGHGFRSIFSTILNEEGFNPDAIERQLAHGCKDKVRDAYNRSDYMDERRKMMQFYADHLDKLREKV